MKQNAPLFPRQVDRIARNAHKNLVYGSTAAIFLFLGWSALTEIDQVVRGAGRVVPQVQNQTVQHFEGGIIKEILVREGQFVEEGETLLRIENSFSRAELSQAQISLLAVRARMQRLEQEAKGETSLKFEDVIIGAIPEIAEQERDIFISRNEELANQINIIERQIRQRELELIELQTRSKNTQKEKELVNQRLESLTRLSKVGAVSNNTMLEEQRILQQIETRLADLSYTIPRIQSALKEAQARKREAMLVFQSRAQGELGEAGLDAAKLNEAINALQDRSARSEVVAPLSGTVNKLYMTTIGGVVKSGEPLVQLVPTDAAIAVEARISPADRANIWPGQQAIVKVSAYDYSIYGGLEGKITDVSPDIFNDENGEPYYRIRLEASSEGLGEGNPITPGMVAEVDVLTGKHSVLSYLTQPLKRLQNNALRQ
jgi:adhesin transport system membrane fusion protein